MTDAAIQWLATKASYLTARELLGEALLLRGFQARFESGRLRVILDHPSDRSVLRPFLDLGADGRVIGPVQPAPPPDPRDGGRGASGPDPGEPWRAAAGRLVAIDRHGREPGGTTEEGWRQFRSRRRAEPPAVVADAECLDLGVALLVRALCLVDCKAIQSCDGHQRDSGREVVRDAEIEFASRWDAMLGASLVDLATGGSPRDWQWSYRSLRVPYTGGHDVAGLTRALEELQRVARALVEHRRWGPFRNARVRALSEYGRTEPHPEEFRAALRRLLEPQAPAAPAAEPARSRATSAG